MTMSADEIELPHGVDWAIKIEGMREIRVYSIGIDGFVWRWDTKINNCQFTHFEYELDGTKKMIPRLGPCPEGLDIRVHIGKEIRAKALAIFKNLDRATVV